MWQLPSTTKGDILAVISDSIPVFDELRYRFLNIAFSCMHCSSDLVSFLVTVRFGLQQACMKSSLERNARFVPLAFACYHLMLECIDGKRIALIKILCLTCL